VSKYVDYVTCTVSANTPEYVFQIVLSDNDMYTIKHHNWLGITFQKNKATFLKDLSEILALHILEELEKMP